MIYELMHVLEEDIKSNQDSDEYAPGGVIADILKERLRQVHKWPRQPTFNDHHWSTVLGEEFGEALREMNEHDYEKLYIELKETAAVAIAWMQKIRKYQEDRDARL